MKKIALALLPVLVLLAACDKVKDTKNYYPQVKTISAAVMGDGSVEVTGELVSEGSTPVLYYGFCMDTLPNPAMNSNQHTLQPGNSFTTRYPSLKKGYTYYFRAWAANENGYAMGTEMAVEGASINPSLIPCAPPLDTLTIYNTSFTKHHKYISISMQQQSTPKWTVHLATNDHTVDMEFATQPIGGVYTVWDNTPDKMNVRMMIDSTVVVNGAKLYVTQINSNTIEVTACGVDFNDGVYASNARTRFRTTY